MSIGGWIDTGMNGSERRKGKSTGKEGSFTYADQMKERRKQRMMEGSQNKRKCRKQNERN